MTEQLESVRKEVEREEGGEEGRVHKECQHTRSLQIVGYLRLTERMPHT